MKKLIFFCLLFFLPSAILAANLSGKSQEIAVEHVSKFELNHFYDEQGRLVFDQIIFSDWGPIPVYQGGDAKKALKLLHYDYEHYHDNVRAWRLIKNTAQWPYKDYNSGKYVSFWFDGEQLRKIYADGIVETWTQYDPELLEREYTPKEARKELKTVQFTKPSKQPSPPVPMNPCPDPNAKNDD